MPTPAYLIVEAHITDPQQYQQYAALAPAVVKSYGGEYLARGGKHETIEGDWTPHRVTVVRFPSYEQAKAFYDDARYRSARTHRQGATAYFNMVLVEGVGEPT
jgi:uncharacterized protein (DUF1330 family)